MMLPMLIGWVIGVPLDIWWPRPVSSEHPGLASAYRLVRTAAGCLLISWALFIPVVLSWLLSNEVGFLQGLSIAFSGGAFMLSPLASCASALDVQKRAMAIASVYCAVLLICVQFWLSVLSLLSLVPLRPYAPLWWVICCGLSTLLAAISLVLVLELYALIRRPPAM
jgi:hypothetical protein